MFTKRFMFLCGFFALILSVGLASFSTFAQQGPPQLETIFLEHHGISPALGNLPAKERPEGPPREIPLRIPHPGAGTPQQADGALQKSTPGTASATPALGFLGVGTGFSGPDGTFTVDAAPPDTNGAVGDTQYVQWVNESFAIFDKVTGAVQAGPLPGNTLWTGVGNGCENNNDGDPIVQYDKAAGRWIFTQFSVATTPYLQCFAISTTSDARGPYNLYSMQMNAFPDYPKLGVWPDAYYITFNMFSGNFFTGAKVCALERAAMLIGSSSVNALCAQLSSSYASLLPADLDGSTAPPSGSPNYLLNLGSNALRLWRFKVNWTTVTGSITGPVTMSVPAFTRACSGGTCIQQKGTGQKLDSLGDRLMYRLAYRNFGDHESLVVNHSVSATGKTNGYAGIRWYELRNPAGGSLAAGTPVVYQRGTYAPDSNSRWMGSIAMDKNGNMAVGYSVSSSAVFPSIRYTGRLAGDSLNTLQAETTVINGTGSQTAPLSRWGDYSSMTIDPGDDCTFWYTNEYLQSNGSWNWSTRIASFSFPGCVP